MTEPGHGTFTLGQHLQRRHHDQRRHAPGGRRERDPSGSAVTLANAAGATLNLNSFSDTIFSLSGGGSTGGNVTLGSGTLTIGDTSATSTFSGVISGSGGLTQQGTGTFTLAAANTYTGSTTINAGRLIVGGTTGSLGTGAVTDNAVLQFNLTTIVTVGNVISGTGSLTTAASGTVTLSAANTYTGATTISAGTLAVNGSTTSAATVSSEPRHSPAAARSPATSTTTAP